MKKVITKDELIEKAESYANQLKVPEAKWNIAYTAYVKGFAEAIDWMCDGKIETTSENSLHKHFVSNSEADCKYKDSCGLFPCNLTECDEYEPKESESAVCRCENSSWNRDAGCFVCDECGERI
jgi:hypothetical protein